MTGVRWEPIIPKNLAGFFDFPRLEREMFRSMNDTIRQVEKDYQATVRTWKRKPTFVKINPRKLFGSIDAKVTTKNKIYFFLEEGTKAHPITPKRGGVLVFRAGYRAKTSPRTLGSKSGGAFGPVVGSRGHMVKGIAPRHFSKEIAKRRRKLLVSLTQRAFMRSFKLSFKFGGTR